MILITGASGFVGSNITRRLVSAGKQVRALIRNPERMELESRLDGLTIEISKGDITQPETLSHAFDRVDTVIHTAAIAIEKGTSNYEEVNFLGAVNIVEAAKGAGVKRFINISQLGADAKLPYRFLASKGKAQDYVAASGLDWTAFRPSAIWGPNDEFANSFARLIPITPVFFPVVGDENARFQLIWVEDVAASVVAAISDPNTIGREYELGGPEILTLETIERRTLEALGRRRILVRSPMGILRIAVTLMEKTLPSPPVTRSLLELLAVSNVTAENAIYKFVPEPRPFTVENIASYMRLFQARQTLSLFFGK